MTRREFLTRLGVVGGSSMVMGAMGALELTATPAGSRPLLSGRAPGTRVLVLGGDISGLAAAYELGKLGYDVQVVVWNRASGREEELTADYALSCLPLIPPRIADGRYCP